MCLKICAIVSQSCFCVLSRLRRRKCGVTHGELRMSARWFAAGILLVHIRLPRHYAAMFMCMQYILRASPESIIAIMPLMIFAQLSPVVMQWAVTRRTLRLCCCCVSPPLGGAPINCDDLRFSVCRLLPHLTSFALAPDKTDEQLVAISIMKYLMNAT